MLRAIIADDHPVAVSGTRVVLRRNDIEVVAEANSADDAMISIASVQADVIVTDFIMPGTRYPDGFVYLSAISRNHPSLKVIVLTMVNRRTILQKMLSAGAAGLVDKAGSLDQIVTAVRLSMRNKTFVSPSMLELIDMPSGPSRAEQTVDEGVLTPREQQILYLIAQGKSVTDISVMLNRSIKTVSTQKRSLMGKLKLRADLDIIGYVRDRQSMTAVRTTRSRQAHNRGIIASTR
jgi:two-component system, NarL family, captular synthesis response regulator RcsB